MKVPNLRSPYEKIGGLFYLPRMLDKIRLHAAGLLPADYIPNLGSGFDGRCCSFLAIDYGALTNEVRGGANDTEALAWALQHGPQPTEEQLLVWNEFMRKSGWRDEASGRLQTRLQENGFGDRADIQTFFDFIDLDEGRDPRDRA